MTRPRLLLRPTDLTIKDGREPGRCLIDLPARCNYRPQTGAQRPQNGPMWPMLDRWIRPVEHGGWERVLRQGCAR